MSALCKHYLHATWYAEANDWFV